MTRRSMSYSPDDEVCYDHPRRRSGRYHRYRSRSRDRNYRRSRSEPRYRERNSRSRCRSPYYERRKRRKSSSTRIRKRRESTNYHHRRSSSRNSTSGSERHKNESKRRREKERVLVTKTTIKNTDEGHLIYSKSDVLNSRYQIKRKLGEGTFGKVVLCKDRLNNDRRVAVKIIRNVPKYKDAAKIEIEILEKIRSSPGSKGSVEMLDWFDHYGHMCIVFEVLGLSVFDFLKDNGFTPFPMAHIQRIGSDLITALRFLHDIKYTHTDLKPENILFISNEYASLYDKHKGIHVMHIKNPSIKVIDFGSATHEAEHHSRVVSTRHYRAPEVITELGWDYSCDMWSVGCILFELYSGHTLFQTHDNQEHLGMMEFILGELPEDMCKRSKKRYFKDGKLQFDSRGSAGRYIKKHCKKLDKYRTAELTSHDCFLDLLKGLLDYSTKSRLTAPQALHHPFFDNNIFERDRRSHRTKSR